MIKIGSHLVLFGLLSNSNVPVNNTRLKEVREKFYKIREEFVVDISSGSIQFDIQSCSFFHNCDRGVIRNPKYVKRFENKTLFENEISGFSEEIKTEIRSVF